MPMTNEQENTHEFAELEKQTEGLINSINKSSALMASSLSISSLTPEEEAEVAKEVDELSQKVQMEEGVHVAAKAAPTHSSFVHSDQLPKGQAKVQSSPKPPANASSLPLGGQSQATTKVAVKKTLPKLTLEQQKIKRDQRLAEGRAKQKERQKKGHIIVANTHDKVKSLQNLQVVYNKQNRSQPTVSQSPQAQQQQTRGIWAATKAFFRAIVSIFFSPSPKLVDIVDPKLASLASPMIADPTPVFNRPTGAKVAEVMLNKDKEDSGPDNGELNQTAGFGVK